MAEQGRALPAGKLRAVEVADPAPGFLGDDAIRAKSQSLASGSMILAWPVVPLTESAQPPILRTAQNPPIHWSNLGPKAYWRTRCS